jgi:hypothetical protein
MHEKKQVLEYKTFSINRLMLPGDAKLYWRYACMEGSNSEQVRRPRKKNKKTAHDSRIAPPTWKRKSDDQNICMTYSPASVRRDPNVHPKEARNA